MARKAKKTQTDERRDERARRRHGAEKEEESHFVYDLIGSASHLIASEVAGSGEAMLVREQARKAVEEGLPVESVRALQNELKRLGVPRPSEYVEAIISRATRSRRTRLKPAEGEKLVRIAMILARAVDVWGDEQDAAEFLTTPHAELGGDTPIRRALSEIGARQVDDILLRLDLGLPV